MSIYEREYDHWLTKVYEDDRMTVGFCDNCRDDYVEGTEVYVGSDGEGHVFTFCCLQCLVSNNHLVDVDNFELGVAEK